MNPECTSILVLRWWPIRVLVCLVMLFAVGCGGDAGNYQAGGGIGGTGVAIGSVSGHGSIVVNGIRFDTSAANICIEDPEGVCEEGGDREATESLPIGREVVVVGNMISAGSGNAISVDAFYRVRGPLQEFEDLGDLHGKLTVMGQTVWVDPQTTWNDITMDDLRTGMVLEVSGPVEGATGAVHAGHIALKADHIDTDTRVAVKGRVRELDGKEFKINGLVVDYSRIQADPRGWEEIPAMTVRGHLERDTLVAAAVEPFVTGSFDSAEDFSLEGYLVPSDGAGQWTMDGYQLQFDEGLGPEGVGPDIRTRVRGRLENRVLRVDTLQEAAPVRLVSNVAWVDPSEGELGLEGMDPLVVRVSLFTRILAGAGDLADIAAGNHVHITAQALGSHSASALKIVVSPAGPKDSFLLEGPVTTIDAHQIAVLGVTVELTDDGAIKYFDAEEHPVTVDVFLSDLRDSDAPRARVTGRWDDDRIGYETMTIVR